MPRSHDSRPSRRGPKPSPERLATLMEEAGVPLDKEQIEALWTFHTFLRERNPELNMTRIHNFENMVLKHYVDSILAAKLTALPSPLVDIGSGAGFPGIPLKIARPELHVVLAEGRARRAEFLQQAVDLLRLEGADVYGHKVGPQRNPARDLGIEVRGVITRALEDIPGTLRRVVPFVEAGARVVFMKGPDCADEIAAAAKELGPAYVLGEDIPYTLPGSDHRRRLVVFVRTGEDAPEAAGATPDAVRSAAAGRPGTDVKDITSPANATFKTLKSLLTSRGIRKERLVLVAGARPAAEVLAQKPALCRAWITPLAKEHDADQRAAAAPPDDAPEGVTWYRLAPALFRELDQAGTRTPLLLAELPEIPEWSDADWPEGCTLFVPFQDPENVGAVIRSAAAFGAARVVLLAEAAHPFLPRSQRAAGSALFRVPLLRGPSIDALAAVGAPLLPLHSEGRDLGAFAFPPRFGLLPGLEGPGLPGRFRTNDALAIPMEPGSESLNAATSVAVALYAWRRGRDAGR